MGEQRNKNGSKYAKQYANVHQTLKAFGTGSPLERGSLQLNPFSFEFIIILHYLGSLTFTRLFKCSVVFGLKYNKFELRKEIYK